ncbi:hypothetical protein ACULNC_22320 [Shigella flexneri]
MSINVGIPHEMPDNYGVYWLIKALAILDGLTERTRRGMNATA